MNTVKVDAKRRIRIPQAEPKQLYTLEKDNAGRFILTLVPVNAQPEAFPPGSLKKHITKARNRQQLALLKGCSLEVED